MDPEERYEKLLACIDELREANRHKRILVEGVRDERALRELGFPGEIRVYNSGKSAPHIAETIAREQKPLIVLLDWDRTGGQLVRRLTSLLAGQVEVDLGFRSQLAQLSQVRSVEDLPAALRHLKKRAHPELPLDGE